MKAIASLKERCPGELAALRRIDRNGKVGYRFWQAGGGYDRNLFSDRALQAALQYIHENPVRRGLVERDFVWRWSSALQHRGLGVGPLAISLEAIVLRG